MLFLYNLIFLPLLGIAARIGALFTSKLQLAVDGRSKLIKETKDHYSALAPDKIRILIHVASFGELEQAKPVIERLKQQLPDIHIHLTFFSPSGYENAAGKYKDPDFISYAPFDRLANVRDFLDIAEPSIALFARYDLWPNMARELTRRKIPSLLFSATFDQKRNNPLLRKFHAETYNQLSAILTISKEDAENFKLLGLTHPSIVTAGDTRFDQVTRRRRAIEEHGTHCLPKPVRDSIAKNRSFVLVAGSTWPRDISVLTNQLKLSIDRKDHFVAIIVPHEPTLDAIGEIEKRFAGSTILLSQCANYPSEKIIIVDSIGKLFSLYQSADAAYVGGGFSAGVHNVLEAAVWGKPVLFGPKNSRSREVGALSEAIGGFEVKGAREFEFVLKRLMTDEDFLEQAGKSAAKFVRTHLGATEKIADAVLKMLPDSSK